MSDRIYVNGPQMAMKKIFRLGKTVGNFSLWYAKPNIGFLKPGIYIWLFGNNRRIIPMRNKENR